MFQRSPELAAYPSRKEERNARFCEDAFSFGEYSGVNMARLLDLHFARMKEGDILFVFSYIGLLIEPDGRLISYFICCLHSSFAHCDFALSARRQKHLRNYATKPGSPRSIVEGRTRSV